MPNDRPHVSVTTLRICLILLLLTINDVYNLESTSQYHSRLYADDEDDRTAIHRLPTDEELALGHEILKQLGLSDQPKSTMGKAALMEQSARKFLINMYKHIANKASEKKPFESLEPSEFDLTGNDFRAIDSSDVLITFTAQHSHQGVKESTWFDVDALPPKYQMTSAQLRLYRALDAENLKNRGAFTVTAYRVLRPRGGEIEMQFVDSANTAAEHEGWITLDVTESLRHWMKHPDDNKGLHVSVSPIDRFAHDTGPEDIGIVRFDGDVERQPFMAAFFRTNEHHNVGLIEPRLRSSVDYNKRTKKRATFDRQFNNPCKVEKLYVTFKDLKWNNWIVFPEGFEANYCSGECSFPLTSHMNATNHAIVQTVANMLYPEIMPKICCVPTQLKSIDVLYHIDDHTTVLKRWGISNMSVQGCGCR